MLHTLTFPLSLFRVVLRRLAQSPSQAVEVEVGATRTMDESQWLARRLRAPDAVAFAHAARVFRLANDERAAAVRQPEPFAGILCLGSAAGELVRGAVRNGAGARPLDLLRLVGPGMHRLALEAPEGQSQAQEEEALDVLRWSRTIGALGGEAVWRRLVSLRIAVVGCGRTGSIVAANLARLGVRQIVLVDPDFLSCHNLGEMQDVGVAALGELKVNALAARLRAAFGETGLSITNIAATVAADEAMAVVKGCDVLVSSSDNDAARLTTGIVATLHHKVMIDVGSGVFFGEVERAALPGNVPPIPSHGASSPRTMGADVRVIVPGDGCLLCRGGLSNFAEAVEDITRRRAHLDPGRVSARGGRAGSLHSLNQVAAGFATRMLEDLVAERLQGSRWVHVEFDERGNVMMRYPYIPTSAARTDCLLCAKAGLGDEGF